MKLFKKSDGLADVVANRFENGGGDTKKAPGIVSRTCSKIQHILHVWKDNRAAKKREKNEKSVDTKQQSSLQKTKEPDLKSAKDILGKTEIKSPEIPETKVKKVRHWTWKHYMVILGLPTLTISPVVYFGVRKFIRKPVVVNNTPPPQIDFPIDENHPVIVEIAKTEQQTTGAVSFIDAEIYRYAIDRFPDKVVDENTKIYYGASEYWRKATGKTPDQKLKSTLRLIHETSNQDDTVGSDFETLSNLWYNDSLQDLYLSALIEEVTTYIKKTPGKEEYKKYLQELIRAIRLNQQYIERLHDGFSKIVVDSMTRDIPRYKEKKAIVDSVASFKDDYDKERAIYDEQIKLGNWRAKRPKAINIKESEREIYNTYHDQFKKLSSNISKKIYKVILRDTISESGKTHLALLEQMRRTRVLKYTFEVGRNLPIKTLEQKISIDLPKDPDEEPSTPSEAVQSPDSSSSPQPQETQYQQSPPRVKQ